jgi:branched-chain amino acid transport system substrate-binding protein
MKQQYGTTTARQTRRRQTGFVGVAAALCVAVGLSACGGSSSGGSSGGSSGSSGGVVKIGLLAESSGSYQEFGQVVDASVRAAVNHVNDHGGVLVHGKHYKFQVVSAPDNSDPSVAVSLANKFVYQDGIKFVTGGLGDIAPSVAPVTDSAKAIFLTSSSALEAEINKTKYAIVQTADPDSTDGAAFAAIRKFWPNAKTVALIGQDEPTANAFFAWAKENAAKYGLKIVASQQIPTDSDNYQAALASIASNHPDVLLQVAISVAAQQTMLKQNQQIHAGTYGMGFALDCPQAKQVGVTNNYASDTETAGSLSDPFTPQLKALESTLNTALKSQNVSSLAPGLWQYDGIGLLAAAMEKAQTTTNTAAIIHAMEHIKYQGVAGPITLTPQHLFAQKLNVCRIDNGTITEHQIDGAPTGS